LTNPAFVAASAGRHEDTFNSGLNAGASHGNRPLSVLIRNKKTGKTGHLAKLLF
jgi:hypothetical protein